MAISGKGQGEGGALRNAILIAGATASGKSALALELARETGGVVVNADSMQVYSVLRVLTARPDAAQEAAAPHLLYGHVDPRRAYSTGHWLREVEELAAKGTFADRPAIFVGGTGLYFRALLEGLSQMPPVPPAMRARWRDRLRDEGAGALHEVLAREDPAAAARIAAGDGQRIVRALEVLEASGRSILAWQGEGKRPPVDAASARRILLEPERGLLNARIAARFERMVEAGALEEVRALDALGLSPDMPAMKAIGVRELRAAMDGKIPLHEAVERAKIATRRYAKRQATWFRHQFGPEWRKDLSLQDTTPNLPPGFQ